MIPTGYQHFYGTSTPALFCDPHIVQEVTPPDAAIAFVGAGAGISLVASHYQTQPTTGVVFRPLQQSLPPLEIAIAWRTDCASEVLHQFLAVIDLYQQLEWGDRSPQIDPAQYHTASFAIDRHG